MGDRNALEVGATVLVTIVALILVLALIGYMLDARDERRRHHKQLLHRLGEF